MMKKPCPSGMIQRVAYTRKYSTAVLQKGFTRKSKLGKVIYVKPSKRNSTYVKPKCIKDTGKPGKGEQLIGPLKKGELTKYGYSIYSDDHKTKKSREERHTALTKAINEYGSLGVYRKLDAVAKLTVRTTPEVSHIYQSDRDWVHANFWQKPLLKK